MEKIEALDCEGRWFVGKGQGAERGAGAVCVRGSMLYVPFLFELCRSEAGGGIPAVGIGPAAAGTVAGGRSCLPEQHV